MKENEGTISGGRDFLRAANLYCFGYGSPTTLGVLRIMIGFLAFTNFCMIGLDWDSWFSERGYVPSWLGSLWFSDKTPVGFGTNLELPRIDLLLGITDPRITIPFYILVVLAAFFTCIGLGTRVAAFMLAVGTVTLHHRNGAILHGGDTVLRICTIYLAVSPCGQACSIDRLVYLWKARDPVVSPTVSLWSQRLFCYNVALIYFTTLWLKVDGDKWRHFIATYYPSRLAEFYKFPVPEFMKNAFFSRITTVATILIEFSLGTLIFFKPLRKWAILGGVLLHGYIEYSMNIPLFAFLMMTLYLAFFDGEEITAWAKRVGERLRKLHVSVDLPSGMQLTRRGSVFLRAIDPFELVTYPKGGSDRFIARNSAGKAIPAVRAVGSRSVGSWCFGWIPGFLGRLLNQCIEPASVHLEGTEEAPRTKFRPKFQKQRSRV